MPHPVEKSRAEQCPLCRGEGRGVCVAWGTTFFRCSACELIYRDPASWPSPEEERARYEQHRNGPEDPGYRAFLAKLAEPVAARVPPGASGLDFGCGPGPTLSAMLEEQGFRMTDFDPIFRPDRRSVCRRYDFITLSEVLEHLHHPAETLRLLEELLEPGGLVAIMTSLMDDDRDLTKWWYARDPTHVCLYSERTLRWVAASRGWALELAAPTVALLTKPRSG